MTAVGQSSTPPWFEILGGIADTETITVGRSIREIARLRKRYGQGRWREEKGVGRVPFADGTICKAEVDWYEAHGVGSKGLKIKRLLK